MEDNRTPYFLTFILWRYLIFPRLGDTCSVICSLRGRIPGSLEMQAADRYCATVMIILDFVIKTKKTPHRQMYHQFRGTQKEEADGGNRDRHVANMSLISTKNSTLIFSVCS